MIRRPPRSTLDRSSAASDVYKRQLQGGRRSRPARGRGRRTAPDPVSYTHLRAHETGRNLVCRLLLEKKKKENTKKKKLDEKEEKKSKKRVTDKKESID